MRADDIVDNTRQTITRILSLTEEVQALAAAQVQQYNKLGGSTAVDDHEWATSDITQQEFVDAIGSLGTAFPDILGAHGTNLYKLKRG